MEIQELNGVIDGTLRSYYFDANYTSKVGRVSATMPSKNDHVPIKRRIHRYLGPGWGVLQIAKWLFVSTRSR